MKKLFLGVLMAGSSFWANAQAQVVVAWYYQEWSITQDSLNYKYNTGTNQLQYITDNVLATVSTTDIDNQNPNNYIYDKSGNMVADSAQSMSVSWSPYGKILQTNKAGGASLQFGYNAMQQRVLKRVVLAGDTTRTYYIRDAQGNTMGVYTRHNDSVTWREQYIFGSSRLGLYRADTLVNKGLTVISKLYEGKRNYELTNHLGNVMAVINDRKTDSLSSTNVKLGFNAVVVSAVDYFPFGMAIDSRSYTSSLYRYGFNGKENDKETGEQDYGMRIYDPRIGKFLSVDPISKKYPELSQYQFASNSPIEAVDVDGKEYLSGKENRITIQDGEILLKIENMHNVTQNRWNAAYPAYEIYTDDNGYQSFGKSKTIEAFAIIKPDYPSKTPNIASGMDPTFDPSVDIFYNPKYKNVFIQGTSDLKTKSGKPDSRNPANKINNNGGIITGTELGGRVGAGVAVLTLLEETANWYADHQVNQDLDKIKLQRNTALNAINDVRKAVLDGKIDKKFLNIKDLSNIANYVLSGSVNESDKNKKIWLEYYGKLVARDYSKNFKGELKTVNSGLDNIKSRKFIDYNIEKPK